MVRFITGLLVAVFLTMSGNTTWAQPGFGRGGRFGADETDQIRRMPVLAALDADKNGELTTKELDASVRVLAKLDTDGDGRLSTKEMEPARTENSGRRRGGFPGMGSQPLGTLAWMRVLDADHDHFLSKDEIANGATSLQKLDKDGDGKIVDAELKTTRPSRTLLPKEIHFADGVASIPDHETYRKLSYKGEEVMIDTFLADLEFVKFTIEGIFSKEPKLYFINTVNHRAHMMFGSAIGLSRGGWEQMKGVLVYRPRLKSPSGEPGLFTFEFEPFDRYAIEMVEMAQSLLTKKMPSLKGHIGYYPRGTALERYEEEKEFYKDSPVRVYLDEDLTNSDVAFLPLNLAESFGRLRLMKIDERPGPRDIVVYKSLPNEMPRVGGIITAVRQTPLSHVNLRAVQDNVPNAFVLNADNNAKIKALFGKYVSYKVTADGYELREAKASEVESHFADLRPSEPQTPKRDLSVKAIRSLVQVKFDDSTSVGVKAANLATMHTFDFPEGTIPQGYAVPFYFYDEFMKHNRFYDSIDAMMAKPKFDDDRDFREQELSKLRKQIKKGKMPEWMADALTEVQKSFPEGQSIRCRSSTNNEDLPSFSGAGLYDSCSHHKDEGHLSKSIKQVYASLWNYRAFEERDFYRIDHKVAAMGVLLHPNFKGELANGVAVTDDIFYETVGNYYLNTQIGEDLVTNPEAESIPEEILIGWYEEDGFQVMRKSNRGQDKLLLSEKHLNQLRSHLGRIHGRFRRLYKRSEDDRFSMEIEFKITKKGKLAIKQARPWVYPKK